MDTALSLLLIFEKPHPSHSFKVGFLKQGKEALIDVDQCPITTPAINEAMPSANHLQDNKQGLKGLTLTRHQPKHIHRS